jgi:large-conductance mechanosensitive channel
MLTNPDLIVLTGAVYLGGVMAKFFETFIKDIVMPILSPLSGASKSLSEFSIRLGRIELKVGEFIAALLTLILSTFLVVTTVGMMKLYVLPMVGGKSPLVQ